MKGLPRVLVALLALFFTSAAPAADRYNVNLTRKDSNLYKVDGTSFWVQTQYCYAYGYGEEAILSPDEVIFLEDGDKCDVKRILKEISVAAGTHEVTLSREDDNLYATLDGTLVETTLCLNLALGDEAILRMNGYGGGTVIFVNDADKCDVETVFSQATL
jgi:hypothetical protein